VAEVVLVAGGRAVKAGEGVGDGVVGRTILVGAAVAVAAGFIDSVGLAASQAANSNVKMKSDSNNRLRNFDWPGARRRGIAVLLEKCGYFVAEHRFTTL
jgi:hypothetical protein